MIAALEITRPHNGILTFCSVLLGGWIGSAALSTDLLVAAASASLIASGGYVLNDVCGVAADRVNRPERPVPSGRISLDAARLLSGLLMAGGLALGYVLSFPVPWLALFAAVSLTAYNLRFQRVPLIGNLVVAGLGALAFLYGGAATGHVIPSIVPATFALVYHLGREILKDAEDCVGDRHLGGSNLALRYGELAARRMAAITCLLVVLLSPLPFLLASYGPVYLMLVVLLDGLLIDVAATAWSPSETDYRALNRLLKAGMFLGLAAVFGDHLVV